MDKVYENATVTVSEEYNSISFTDEYGNHVGSYSVKTDEEKEYLRDRYNNQASMRLLFSVVVLMSPFFIIALSFFKDIGWSAFLQQPQAFTGFAIIFVVTIPLFLMFFTALLTFVTHYCGLEQAAKEDKSLKFFLFAAIILAFVH